MDNRITEAALRSRSSPESFSRGQKLFKTGAIFDAYRRGELIGGNCEGESEPFYRLRIRLSGGGIREASCSCPYDYGGYCKHIIALALANIQTPDIFLVQKDVDELLEPLNKKKLVKLIARLTDTDPDAYTWLELAVGAGLSTGRSSEKSMQGSRLGDTDYGRQVRRILSGWTRDGRWGSDQITADMVDPLEGILNAAEIRLEEGDPRAALEISSTLLMEIGAVYDEFDDSDGELGAFLDELTQPLVESILSAGLAEPERARLEKELEPPIRDLLDHGIETMEAVTVALRHGHSPGGKDAGPPDPILIDARLNILERGGRVDEFLDLCRETGASRRCLLKLVELGRTGKSFDAESKKLNQAEDSLSVAAALRESGREPEALRIAERGLSQKGRKYELGAWLLPIAEAQGRSDLHLRACRAMFSEMPSLELYVELKRLYGSRWEVERPKILKPLRKTLEDDVLADILLAEEEWDEAIGIADRADEWGYEVVEKVAGAVLPHRPEWVIAVARKQAESLIAKTKSKCYPIAARWLGKMKQACAASGKNADWSTYLERLKEKYPRRRALQTELEKL
ncbi:MAG: SWIM zinc finger family protein [Anaerolineales bacterium]